MDKIIYEVEQDVPISHKKPVSVKNDPLNNYINLLLKELKRGDDKLVPLKKFITNKIETNLQGRVRIILNTFQQQQKEEENKEFYFECKSVKDGNKELIGIKISRIY